MTGRCAATSTATRTRDSRGWPADEVLRLEALYRERYDGWNVKHFMERYRSEHGGTRSYAWVKRQLQSAGLVKPGRRRGKYRLRRPRAPMPGMLIHQDASITHAWCGSEVGSRGDDG